MRRKKEEAICFLLITSGIKIENLKHQITNACLRMKGILQVQKENVAG